MKQITDAILNNDFLNAQRLNNKYLEMMNLLFVETSPSPVKFVMYEMGLCKNILRLPLSPISKKSEELILNGMKSI